MAALTLLYLLVNDLRYNGLAGWTSALLPARRSTPLTMGGLTGLPRIPPQALALTRKWNPGCEYSETIATLWRDLCTLYGEEQYAGLGGDEKAATGTRGRYVDTGVKTGKTRGFTRSVDSRLELVLQMVRKEPTLLDPKVSNRFEFGRAKAILTEMLGSQRAAIDVMKADPSILQLGSELEGMSLRQVKLRVASRQLTLAAPTVLFLAAALAAVANGVLEYGGTTSDGLATASALLVSGPRS
uniref:Uncharacterized protein n=1 Tax=Coccolithus braarudii TaxID=221442 RepID=A0A7S0Q426_9EUKA|mmetsp:Transcript_32995/g.70541  ORF Transcript_32995/g.70541 Transcript_32995/m.70541 type:complete len:242 (+) Transcript_32995:9-734(+)